jgi:hypothetical protein
VSVLSLDVLPNPLIDGLGLVAMDSVGEIVEIHTNAVHAGFANTALMGQRGDERRSG